MLLGETLIPLVVEGGREGGGMELVKSGVCWGGKRE